MNIKLVNLLIYLYLAVLAFFVWKQFFKNNKIKNVQYSEEDIQFVDDFIRSSEELINKLEEKRKSKLPLIIGISLAVSIPVFLFNIPFLLISFFGFIQSLKAGQSLLNAILQLFSSSFISILQVLIAPIGVFYVIVGLFKHRLIGDYIRYFKEVIITKIIKYLGTNNYTYTFNSFIESHYFKESELFNTFNSYTGDDLITGEINSLKFQCSELHVKYTSTHISGNKRSTSTTPIFDGLFFVIDLHVNTQIPFGTKFTFGSEILLDNIEFSQLFKVFGNDSTEVFYILSSKVLEKMVNYVHKTGQNFQFSFKGNKLYIAIEAGTTKQFFEPPIFKSLWDYKIYDEIVMDFKLIFELLNQLEFRRSLT